MFPRLAAKRHLLLLALAAILLQCYFGDILTNIQETLLRNRIYFRSSKHPNQFNEPQLELVVAATKNEDTT